MLKALHSVLSRWGASHHFPFLQAEGPPGPWLISKPLASPPWPMQSPCTEVHAGGCNLNLAVEVLAEALSTKRRSGEISKMCSSSGPRSTLPTPAHPRAEGLGKTLSHVWSRRAEWCPGLRDAAGTTFSADGGRLVRTGRVPLHWAARQHCFASNPWTWNHRSGGHT